MSTSKLVVVKPGMVILIIVAIMLIVLSVGIAAKIPISQAIDTSAIPGASGPPY